MDLRPSVHDLLKETGPGHMLSAAYGTAWPARLAELGEPLGEQALEWLRDHQLADGSWGVGEFFYCHDRLICTLAAATALARCGDARDAARLRRAQAALETLADAEKLDNDLAGATVGFEMIVPTLVAEAETLGVIRRKDSGLLDQLSRQRAAKLAMLPRGVVNRFVPVVFSAEMAGLDGRHLLDVENLQEANGSLGGTPSATAYFALYVVRQDAAALRYLREIAVNDDGGFPDVAPIDIFEPAWMLWNLALAGPLDDDALTLSQPHLDFLEAAWKPGEGLGHAAAYTPREVDDTSFAYEVLTHFGRRANVEDILSYEDDDHFCLYKLETNTSLSANVHVLGALRRAGLRIQHPSIQKLVGFLRRTQTQAHFWLDKVHVSPYYPTAHAVVAGVGYADDLIGDAARWILATQNVDGSWGYYIPTAEETAYCLQALVTWKRHGGLVPSAVLKRGAAWLAEHANPPYPSLWIGKSLYCPDLVIRSAVLSALMLVEQEE